MAKNNIKLLTPRELSEFNAKYRFNRNATHVIVSIEGYNRITLHDIDKPFTINSKIRKVTFTTEAINLWRQIDLSDCSLLDIQQAVNYLILSYQEVNLKNVKNVLNYPIKIKNKLEEGETE